MAHGIFTEFDVVFAIVDNCQPVGDLLACALFQCHVKPSDEHVPLLCDGETWKAASTPAIRTSQSSAVVGQQDMSVCVQRKALKDHLLER
jgi:hypothetical protein